MLRANDALSPLDTIAVENFREYLRIPSVQPNVNYDECVNFLERQAVSIDLKFDVLRDEPNNPVVVFTWIGTEPTLPTIMLNSHMDVVPVFEDKWIHKPFDAVMDEEGNIYGRGAQDTKYLGIEYLEAIRRLKHDGFQPRRTVHVTFVPDEEAGGVHGMKKFVESNYFKQLRVGFALDEGANLVNNTFYANYDENVIWGFAIHCKGKSGHGSRLFPNTAGEKVHYLLNKFYKYRATQKAIQEKHSVVAKSTSVNVTIIEGGIQSNVLPNELIIKIDTRSPSTDLNNFNELVKQWCKDAGDDVWIEDIVKGDSVLPTKLDETNPYWTALKNYFENKNLKLLPIIVPGATDARYLRGKGTPTIGFTPTQNTPFRMHDNNEFLNVNEFLKDECVNFLKRQAVSIGLKIDVLRNVPNNPVVIFTWTGKNPKLPTIMLNSHMDVVPVFEENWIHKPFDAVMDDEGNIYGRGAQDTKHLGIEYLEAIRRLKLSGFQPMRTVHVTFVPDEEIGGHNGMEKFVETDYFQKLNVGFALDEGGNLPDTFLMFYDEKVSWKFAIHCEGAQGDGSRLINNTAGEKVYYLLNKFYELRATQKTNEDKLPLLAKSTSINLTVVQGGVQANVLPSELIITTDTRSPTEDFKVFEKLVKQWCKEAGENVWIEDFDKGEVVPPTKIDETNPYWTALANYFKERDLQFLPAILSATSDARFLRKLGIPTIGFSPILTTIWRGHNDNEFLNAKEFLNGIKLFTEILPILTNV